MDLTKETIKTKSRKPLLMCFSLLTSADDDDDDDDLNEGCGIERVV
jgi:hypothetical protein